MILLALRVIDVLFCSIHARGMKSAFAAILISVSSLCHAADQWDAPLPPPEIMWWQNGGEMTFDALEEKAATGDARSMAQLALRLMTTRERPYDESRSFKLLTDSAAKGDVLAHTGLAWCYNEGRGCATDGHEQYKHAKAAAKDGFHHGVYQLALCYSSGTGVPYDEQKMYELLDEAIEKGNPWAKRWKARNLLGTERRAEALEALEDLAAKDFPAAQYDLAWECINSGEKDRGMELMKKSVLNGYSYGMARYGQKMISEGNTNEGLDWVIEGYERGSYDGLKILRDYARVWEFPKQIIYRDRSALVHLFEEENQRIGPNDWFTLRLAKFYIEGRGVEINYKRAAEMAEETWKIYDRKGKEHNCEIAALTSTIYSRAEPPLRDIPKALWYAQYIQHPDVSEVGYIAFFHSMDDEKCYDPVRGWAAVLTARKKNMQSPILDQAIAKLEGKLDDGQLAEAEKLSEDGFPIALKYKQEAARALGHKVPTRQLPK